jgi:hypothetical protein
MSNNTGKHFIRSLFDFDFHHFITLKVLGFLYGLFTVLIVFSGSLVFLVGLVSLFIDDSDFEFALFSTFLALPGTLLFLIINRLIVEFYANIYRIGENTQKLVDQIQPKV